MARIAVSLSGGGYRASAFGLGALLYLVDSGRNREVNSISSVSGGSITNGFVAQAGGFNALDSDDFRGEMRPLAYTIAQETLWSTPLVWFYLLVLVLSLGCVVWWPFWGIAAPLPGVVRLLIFLALLLPWGWLLQQRGVLAGLAFGSKLFKPGGRVTRLNDIEKGLDHIICATHLNAGEHFYFSGNFVYSYRFGWGVPGGLPLRAAVQASAAFPGGFPTRRMGTARFAFKGGKGGNPVPRVVTLADGGVYDNMADQWPSRVEGRKKGEPAGVDVKVPDELIVVNSSAGLGWSLVRRLALPLVGELFSLLRDVDVMYDNSASLRMKGLVSRFNRANEDPTAKGLRGVLVTIEQGPTKVPKAFQESADPGQARRAKSVLELLDTGEDWEGIAKENAGVATTLSALGSEVTARLMRYGYATAMANLHVILDYPLLEVPPQGEFEGLTN